jgi:hypothetical protein
MVVELRALAAQLRRRPTLLEYLSETGYDLAEVYKPSIGGWHALLSETELLSEHPAETDVALSKRFQLLLHVDSIGRLRLYRNLLTGALPSLDALPPGRKANGRDAHIPIATERSPAGGLRLGHRFETAEAERFSE